MNKNKNIKDSNGPREGGHLFRGCIKTLLKVSGCHFTNTVRDILGFGRVKFLPVWIHENYCSRPTLLSPEILVNKYRMSP